jgi:hypothetical protein
MGLVWIGLLLIGINARWTPTSKVSSDRQRSCSEEYRELRRRDDDERFDSDSYKANDDDDDDDDDGNGDQWRENVCEQAMNLISRHRRTVKMDPTLLRTYCPYYDESLALAGENNDTLCEEKKRELLLKRKRNAIDKKKRDNESDDDDDDEDNKRRALRRRQLKKRIAFMFMRKPM